jgi:pimeloyl-ACP methyl ester carboxylesterase
VTTFALVFGAAHGPWCWAALAAELRARGHEAVTPDFACDDPALGTSDYATAVVDSLAGIDDDVALVGHSLGGLTIPIVAERRPIAHLVLLCALLPEPGMSLDEQARTDPSMWAPQLPEGGHVDVLYNCCRPDVAAAARAQLRPQARTPFTEKTPVTTWPPAPACTSIFATHDLVVNPAWSPRATRDRLGVEAIEIDTDHSPFLSAPRVLAELLVTALRASA